MLQSKLPPSNSFLRSLFQSLLIADISLTPLALPIAFWQNSLSESWLDQAGLEMEMTGVEMFIAALGIMLLVVILPSVIVAWVGMFRYRNWARWLYLFLIVAGYLLAIPMACFDYSLQWGLLTAIEDLVSPVQGALVAIAFLSPLASDFSTGVEVEVVSGSS